MDEHKFIAADCGILFMYILKGRIQKNWKIVCEHLTFTASAIYWGMAADGYDLCGSFFWLHHGLLLEVETGFGKIA